MRKKLRLARWRFVVWLKYTDVLVPEDYRHFDRIRPLAPPRPR